MKQARLETTSKPQKLAAMTLPDKRVPPLTRVLEWACNTNDRYHVSELLQNYPVIMEDDFVGARTARCRREYVCSGDYDYNYVIPNTLVTKLDAVVEAEKMKRKRSKYFGNVSDSDHLEGTTEEIIAFFPGGTPKFTSGAVYRMKSFYDIRRKCDAWLADMDWVLSTKWDNILTTPELFDEETDSDELTPSIAGEKHKALADDVTKILGDACLGSTFRLSSGVGTVKVDHLVGMLARDRILNDMIIDFSLRCICNSLGDCYTMDSHAPTFGHGKPPTERISRFHYVVLPVHLSDIHWGIIIVHLNYQHDFPRINSYYYEPLCSNAYRATMEDIYEGTVANFLREWHNETMPTAEHPIEASGVWIDAPEQPDGTSCGMLCIAQAYAMMKDSFRFTQTTITRDNVAVMRLRIMWMLLTQPDVTTRTNKIARAVADTDVDLLATVMK